MKVASSPLRYYTQPSRSLSKGRICVPSTGMMNRRRAQRAFANARQELRMASVSEACLRKSVVNNEHGVQVGCAEDIPRALPTKPVVERRGGTCIRSLAHKPQTDNIRMNGCQKGDYTTLLQRTVRVRLATNVQRFRVFVFECRNHVAGSDNTFRYHWQESVTHSPVTRSLALGKN